MPVALRGASVRLQRYLRRSNLDYLRAAVDRFKNLDATLDGIAKEMAEDVAPFGTYDPARMRAVERKWLSRISTAVDDLYFPAAKTANSEPASAWTLTHQFWLSEIKQLLPVKVQATQESVSTVDLDLYLNETPGILEKSGLAPAFNPGNGSNTLSDPANGGSAVSESIEPVNFVMGPEDGFGTKKGFQAYLSKRFNVGESPETRIKTLSQKHKSLLFQKMAQAVDQGQSSAWTRDEFMRSIGSKLKDADVRKQMASNVMRIVRTEYGQASNYVTSQFALENHGVIKELERVADGRPCLACVALDGVRYPVGATMDDHPNGMCTFAPVLMTLEELGYTKEEIPVGYQQAWNETGRDYPTLSSRFYKLPPAEQLKVFGNNQEMFDLWREHRFPIQFLAVKKQGMMVPPTVAEVRAALARFGSGKNALSTIDQSATPWFKRNIGKNEEEIWYKVDPLDRSQPGLFMDMATAQDRYGPYWDSEFGNRLVVPVLHKLPKHIQLTMKQRFGKFKSFEELSAKDYNEAMRMLGNITRKPFSCLAATPLIKPKLGLKEAVQFMHELTAIPAKQGLTKKDFVYYGTWVDAKCGDPKYIMAWIPKSEIPGTVTSKISTGKFKGQVFSELQPSEALDQLVKKYYAQNKGSHPLYLVKEPKIKPAKIPAPEIPKGVPKTAEYSLSPGDQVFGLPGHYWTKDFVGGKEEWIQVKKVYKSTVKSPLKIPELPTPGYIWQKVPTGPLPADFKVVQVPKAALPDEILPVGIKLPAKANYSWVDDIDVNTGLKIWKEEFGNKGWPELKILKPEPGNGWVMTKDKNGLAHVFQVPEKGWKPQGVRLPSPLARPLDDIFKGINVDEIGPGGQAFVGGDGLVEGQEIVVRKWNLVSGKTQYDLDFKLLRGDSLNFTQELTVVWDKFTKPGGDRVWFRAHPGNAVGIDDHRFSRMSGISSEWQDVGMKGVNIRVQTIRNERALRAYHGRTMVSIEVEEGVDLAKAMKAAQAWLEENTPTITRNVLAGVTSEEEAMFKLKRLLWNDGAEVGLEVVEDMAELRSKAKLLYKISDSELDKLLVDMKRVQLGNGHFTYEALPRSLERSFKTNMTDYRLTHETGYGQVQPAERQVEIIADLIEGGRLESITTRQSRALFNVGMQGGADLETGGADFVFMRLSPASDVKAGRGARFVFSPDELKRTDWFAYMQDNYGITHGGTFQSRGGRTHVFNNPGRYARNSGNEFMFNKVVTLRNVERIEIADFEVYRQVNLELTKRGIRTWFDGRPLKEVIKFTGQGSTFKP